MSIETHACELKDYVPIAAGCCSELLIPKTIQAVLQSGFCGSNLRKWGFIFSSFPSSFNCTLILGKIHDYWLDLKK